MKKLLSIFMACALTAVFATGCTAADSAQATAETTISSGETLAKTLSETSLAEGQSEPTSKPPSSGKESAGEPSSLQPSSEKSGAKEDLQAVRVGSLKGPTSIGLVALMYSEVPSSNAYDFTMVTAADELVAGMAGGDFDIALLPANVAGVLYNKLDSRISVIDINTLGVLSIVSSDASIQSVADLRGKTIYMTGKGTTPDYVIHYLLNANGLTGEDVTLEYKSEPSEVAALLKEKSDAIGLLPQPFVTVACAQNENLKIVLDLTAEWDKVQEENGSRLVTGVTIVSNDFLKDHEEVVKAFLADHKASAAFTASNLELTAELVATAGIIEKAPIAEKALPYCNITYIDGDDMKAALSGYLEILLEQDAKSIGGALPGDDFYYGAQ